MKKTLSLLPSRSRKYPAYRLAVDAIDHVGAVPGERHHRAVAGRRCATIEGQYHTQRRQVRPNGPGDEFLGFHVSLRAHLGEQRVVERRGPLEIACAESDIADHDVVPDCAGAAAGEYTAAR
jgi:hypothetical protein